MDKIITNREIHPKRFANNFQGLKQHLAGLKIKPLLSLFFALPLLAIVSSNTVFAKSPPVITAKSQDKVALYCRHKDLFPSKLENIQFNKKTRLGQFKFKTHGDEKSLNGFYYLPSNQNNDSPVVFVIHGTKRNAEDYLKTFAPLGERYNAIVIAPEFSKKHYPKSLDFSLGVNKSKPIKGRLYRESYWKQPYEYLYNEIEHLFEGVKQKLNLDNCGYYLFGHSAGGQFVHRMVSFAPKARIIRAVAANSGWYTLASKGSGRDPNFYMPYGLQGSPLNGQDLSKSFAKELIILVGEEDILSPKEDKYVRSSKQAMAQGENRYERAIHYYNTAKRQAQRLKATFNWRLAVVPKANHSSQKMAQSAAWFLTHNMNQKPCMVSSEEDGKYLIINEIHADPQKGSKGDANNDGKRHKNHDEFIELVNSGTKPLCLSGWVLGDHKKARRHVFPIGTVLQPGQYLLVFGGGIPKGRFANALVQTANFSKHLSLSNKGDGIRISDNYGKVVQHISWGNCGEKACAKEHIKIGLGIDQSIRRKHLASPAWVHHRSIDGNNFSPGF